MSNAVDSFDRHRNGLDVHGRCIELNSHAMDMNRIARRGNGIASRSREMHGNGTATCGKAEQRQKTTIMKVR